MILSNQKNADSWLRLRERMQDVLKTFPVEWAYSPNLDVPKSDAERQWDAFWVRHRKVVDSWILRWVDGEDILEDDLEIRFLIAARFHAVSMFCGLLVFSYDGRFLSPFPFPDGSNEDVLRAYLLDWCVGKGMFLLFDDGWINKMNIE